MSSTPPPPSLRARTPPTPQFGAKVDSYEPFSPRRSSRINPTYSMSQASLRRSERSGQISQELSNGSDKRKPTFRRTSSQTFSPPSSPISPPRMTSATLQTHNEPSMRKRVRLSSIEGVGHDEETTAASHPNPSGPANLFPTPAKTPQKRAIAQGPAFRSTARVLFPGSSMHPDDEMPTPRKSKKTQRANALTLGSFESAGQSGDQIEIYTDSKERVPELDEHENNPFLARRGGTKQRDSHGRAPKSSKTGMGAAVDAAVENDEGMVYVFRGKKIFKRFDSPSNAGPDDAFGDAEVRRAAGSEANRHFTRSSIKPRLLFPAAQASMDSDEEAVTDVEQADERPVASATPSRRTARMITPPSTTRKTRTGPARDGSPSGPVTEHATSTQRRPSKSPFDYWQRTKPSQNGGKRAAEAMEPRAGKRSCSANPRSAA